MAARRSSSCLRSVSLSPIVALFLVTNGLGSAQCRSIHSSQETLRDLFATEFNSINSYVTSVKAAPQVCVFPMDNNPAASAATAAAFHEVVLPGRITVLTKFDSEYYVMRKVVMFNKLESRFRHAGYSNVKFVVVYSNSATATTNSTATTMDEPALAPAHTAIVERLPTVYNVTVLKETRQSEDDFSPFSQLEASAAYIFDECARLAYIIYFPWSSIQSPYVKASILSTIFDSPCGECPREINSSSPLPTTDSSDISEIITEASYSTMKPNATTDATQTESDNNFQPLSDHLSTAATRRANLILNEIESDVDADQEYVIPMQIVVPSIHAHLQFAINNDTAEQNKNDSAAYYLKFNYIVLQTNDPEYHAHLADDVPEHLGIIRNNRDETLVNSTMLRNEYGDRFRFLSAQNLQKTNNSTVHNGTMKPQFLPIYADLQLMRDAYDAIDEEQSLVNAEESISNQHGQLVSEDSSNSVIADEMTSQEHRKSNEHYSKILQWIQFVL